MILVVCSVLFSLVVAIGFSCLIVFLAVRGVKGSELLHILPLIGGAPLLTLISALLTRWIRGMLRPSRGDGANEPKNRGKS